MKTMFSLALAFLAVCVSPGSVAAAPTTAPAWELKDLDGKPVKWEQFKGKVVLIDFWATWCPPCRGEIPGLIELQKAHEAKGFTIIGVSLDQGEDVVRKFKEKMGINYPIVMGDEAVTAKFGGIEAIPTKFLIDREGRVVSTSVGGAERADIEKLLLPLLDKK